MTDVPDRLAAVLADRYSIRCELGSGGMATVYLAHDLRHDRQVAIKVLRPELAAVLGAERFLNEIKVTANLQHPHILPLFDSGEAGGFLFYVMPFVEGETLQDKLRREKQLPVDEAVRIATEVAHALDYAHRHDVIHRDIKPGNILLHEGQALVADFGIALAVTVAGGNRVTETGLSLGTPEYMSPEQATADRELDARSDVYSLGAVLYEMLVGEPPHTGPSVQAIISRVVTGRVEPVSSHRPSVPIHVDAAVQVALQKLAADRFQSAQAFAGALTGEHAVTAPRTRASAAPAPSLAAAWLAVRKHVALVVVAALVLGCVLGWFLARLAAGPNAAREVTRFTIPVGPTRSLDVAVSPDGKTLVYQAGGMLHVQPLDRFESRQLAGTEGGGDPFFSPDGRWIGFVQDWVLKKIPVDGGPILEITDLPLGWLFGAHWAETGDIVYSWVGGVRRVRATGGIPDVITVLDTTAEHAHYWPQLLDDGNLLLFTAGGPSGLWEHMTVVLEDLNTGARQVIARKAGSATYVSTGHILYSQADGTLLAVPFDLERREATGDPFPVESGIYTSARGRARFSLSSSGTLAFVRGSPWSDDLLLSVDRSGRAEPLAGPFLAYFPLFSPDARRVAISIGGPDYGEVFLLDLDTRELERLTFEAPWEDTPIWSPDGRRMVYSSEWYGAGVNRVQVKPVEPAAQPEALFTGTSHIHLTSWSPDGRWLAFEFFAPDLRRDVRVVQVDSVDNMISMVSTAADEGDARFSPDGRWLAYRSDESGQDEIFVVPFPPTGGKQQVSIDGGSALRWAAETGELFYWRGDTLMVTRVSTESQFRREIPRALFVLPGQLRDYDVTPHGQRFVVKVENPSAWPTEVFVVRNWFEVLEERAGARQR